MKTAKLSKLRRVPSRSALCIMNRESEARNKELREALSKMIERSSQLYQGPTSVGLQNRDAIAQARAALAKSETLP